MQQNYTATEPCTERSPTLDELRRELQNEPEGNVNAVEKPVPEALAQLESAESRLHAALDYLSDRLDGVLSPESPNADKSATPGRPYASELHGRLMGGVYRVNGAAERVERLLARLTL